jgi:hypothetical protein
VCACESTGCPISLWVGTLQIPANTTGGGNGYLGSLG